MHWLFQNFRKRAKFALANPIYAARALTREIVRADEFCLEHITGVPAGKIREYIDEPISTSEFARALKEAQPRFRAHSIMTADLFGKKVLLQYAAVRALSPETVVETGVANGVSTAYLLLALNKNGHGQLHSVGLDDNESLPPGERLGWLVPDCLRTRWRLHSGDARDLLPRVLRELGSVDVFIHDSRHTYEHMRWEFETAFARLRAGGLLISDDVLWNDAFAEFARTIGERDARVLRGVGFLRKSRGDAT